MEHVSSNSAGFNILADVVEHVSSMTDYAKLSIPRPLFERLNDPAIRALGFRSPSDAAMHAIRVFLERAGGEA